MRLDMTLWSQIGTIRYGIAISMDYEKQLYGWKANVIDNKTNQNLNIEFGKIYVENLSPFRKITEDLTNKEKINKPCLLEDFIRNLKLNINNCIVYTGAGLSEGAGIWNLQQLRKNLFLNNCERFIWSIQYSKNEILQLVEQFAVQLYETEPTKNYMILSELQKKYNITIMTENRDILHQKSGHKVITRDIIKHFPKCFLNKTLLIIGVSNDHSGFIHLYRSINTDNPVFIVNRDKSISYIREKDWFFAGDLNEFFESLSNASNN